MENVKHELRKELLQAVKSRAKLIFRGRWNRKELTDDAISLAWQADINRPPDATDKSVAYYACKRAKCGRQFKQSVRSIDGPNPRGVEKPVRQASIMGLIQTGKRDDPAEVAMVRVDLEDFKATLTQRENDYLLAFMIGESTSEIADRNGVTAGAVSQRRRKMVKYWEIHTS